MNLSVLPNALSVLRIFLTLPVCLAIFQNEYALALALFSLAGATDALDGWFAKRFSWQSRLGSILDPSADKILLIGSYCALYLVGFVPLWFLALIFFRDVIIVTGVVGFFLGVSKNEGARLTPSNLSKINTVLQIALVFQLMLAQIYPPLLAWQNVGVIVVATSTVLSGADYIWLWVKEAFLKERKR